MASTAIAIFTDNPKVIRRKAYSDLGGLEKKRSQQRFLELMMPKQIFKMVENLKKKKRGKRREAMIVELYYKQREDHKD